MEKSSKRGKIPQHDWPSIISRYESGETLASIARTYDCSPPAISYIVSRTRARTATAEGTAPKADTFATVEPQLVKAAASPIATNDIADGELMHSNDSSGGSTPPATQAGQTGAVEHSAKMPDSSEKGWFIDQPAPPPAWKAQGNGENDRSARDNGEAPRDSQSATVGIEVVSGTSPRTPDSHRNPPQTGEARRTLHLSLPQGNGSPPAPAPHHAANVAHIPDGQPASHPQTQSGSMPQPRQPSLLGGERGSAAAPDASPKNRESGAFIDHALRERISDDIAVFLAAFDAALDHDTTESRTGLREATDRLLRAGARTRIELERLEARVPLPPRDPGSRPSPAFRPR